MLGARDSRPDGIGTCPDQDVSPSIYGGAGWKPISRTMARDLPKSQLLTRTSTADSGDLPGGQERSFQGIVTRSRVAMMDLASSRQPENTVRRAARSAWFIA